MDEKDFSAMERFYEADLSAPENLRVLPDSFFDCIILSHIIEHLVHGEEILVGLAKKLAPGGLFYLEFPSAKSPYLPKMKGPFLGGSLNFSDDPTHVRLYLRNELEQVLKNNGCEIIRSGVRRSVKRIILFPIYVVGTSILFKCFDGGTLWDILGFAEFIIAQKSPASV